MAERENDVDIDDIGADEELENALCVLAGSDLENCSYSQVRRVSCTAAIEI